MPIGSAPRRDRALELVGVVRLDQRVEAELGRVRRSAPRAVVVEVAQEQEHGVCAGSSRVRSSLLLREEALGEERQPVRRARGPQIVDDAAEAVVDEDRDRGRACALERRRRARRIGVRAAGRPRKASAA